MTPAPTQAAERPDTGESFVSAHAAGRELDALVAEKIFGWRREPYEEDGGRGFALWPPNEKRPMTFVAFESGSSRESIPSEHGERLKMFSGDISAAWEVVEKIAGRNGDTIVSVTRNSLDGERVGGEAKYFVTIEDVSDGIEEWEASADTAPLAICLAAKAWAEADRAAQEKHA